MIDRLHKRVGAVARRRRMSLVAPLTAVLALASVVAAGCAVQESNTYPIELFSEMHYAQSTRSQEPPRLPPVDGAIVFQGVGSENRLDVPDVRERPYDAARARELYRVNCSVCHGDSGVGDGSAAAAITSPRSVYAATQGEPYASPANLKEKRGDYDRDAMVTLITNGILVMPRFGNLLTEEEIREIATYIYDEQTGLGR